MDMDEKITWLALTRIHGVGGVLGKRLLEVFGSPRGVFAADPETLSRIDGMTRELFRNLRPSSWKPSTREWTEELQRAEGGGARFLVFSDPEYPAGLREIPDPPLALYLLGRLLPEDRTAVAVVGSRHPTLYGKAAARRISGDLAAAGITVVSGMARGIDSHAHQAALEAGGRTVAVLGSGILVPYPRENRSLMERISASGAVLSEFPPDAPPEPFHFPRRNRIISGASLGTVVVEAAEESGSLITARSALDQGRDVFAVPGPVTSPLSRGTHRLIREGARLTESVKDILEELSIQLTIPEKRGIKQNSVSGGADSRTEILPGGSDEERKVLTSLTDGTPKHPDDITAASNLPAQRVAAVLLSLEMKGVVRRDEGNLYLRN